MRQRMWAGVGALSLVGLLAGSLGAGAGCGATQPADGPLRMEVRALAGGACAPDPGAVIDPLSDLSSLEVVVTGLDAATGERDVLEHRTFKIAGGRVKVTDIPAGRGHKLELWGHGAQATWYAMAPDVNVRRQEDTPLNLVLSRYGAVTQLAVDAGIGNTLFPAVANVGDGRVMVSGGFQTADGAKLSGPSGQWLLYNSGTGAIEASGSMPAGQERGAHEMVYLPETNQVLFVGGARELAADPAAPVPVSFDAAAQGISQCLLFNLVDNTFAEVTPALEMTVGGAPLGRAFTRSAVLSDGLVVVTGGGSWPQDTDTRYRRVSIFNPLAEGGGAFQDVHSFDTFSPRAGHTMTPLRRKDGLSWLLVWGGTPSGQTIGEVLRQSSRQADGVDGNFVPVTIEGDAPSYVFFHQTTPLFDPDAVDEAEIAYAADPENVEAPPARRFLVTGGARHGAGGFEGPVEDEAWLLTYSDTDGYDPKVSVQRVPGMSAGRLMHTAATVDHQHVVLAGGWGATGPLAAAPVVFFDAETLQWRAADEGQSFLPRVGQGGVMTPGGSLFLAGGEDGLTAVDGSACGHLEIYTPSNIPMP